jgi:hypothetical protein
MSAWSFWSPDSAVEAGVWSLKSRDVNNLTTCSLCLFLSPHCHQRKPCTLEWLPIARYESRSSSYSAYGGRSSPGGLHPRPFSGDMQYIQMETVDGMSFTAVWSLSQKSFLAFCYSSRSLEIYFQAGIRLTGAELTSRPYHRMLAVCECIYMCLPHPFQNAKNFISKFSSSI